MATPIIRSLSEISDRYDALFCDLWGCLHNGVRTYESAVAALQEFRRKGGAVALMTNAPRPAEAVARQLERMGAPRDCYDLIVSSGGVAKDAVASGAWGRKVHHIGAPKDEPFFEGLDVARVPIDEAESIVCTGLHDDMTETPEDYADVLREGRLRGLRMLCANPDITVDVGEKRIYCAGALAQAYEEIGGEAVTLGKPKPPIYDAARRMLAEIGREVEDDRILCVGDGIHTDIAGGAAEDLDTLFVTGGLAAPELGPDAENPDPALLEEYLARHALTPTAAIGRLR